ncbi:secreted RxLR effector protein 161-like [Tripterygium wilfordii]|uniref:secreted RxLR effector protein 161-like n=1 Tax=Tripterygium wilfordii TaxID=458696 RepID=UPI0018F819E7|nr:secreted RxLR effector protein 161-like [Tripterygium wilfordii]
MDLLQEADMLHSKSARTPLDSKLQLTMDGESLGSFHVYQRLVEKLIYLTITRPYISHAVSIVSQFMHSPIVAHMNLVKRILCYLKWSIGRGILMKNNGHSQILGYTDADWAGNTLDRKSMTGYCVFDGGNLVSWKSKTQMVVAHSSAEAEYCAMASTASELIWLKALLADLGISHAQSMTFCFDNQAAMFIASDPVIATQYTCSHDQLADIFIKALPSDQFHRILFKLGSINLLDPA